jgi:FkbM family methyltransferase
MMEKKLDKAFQSLAIIGKNEALRRKFIALCHEVEESIELENQSVRDEITGAIIDALHSNVGILQKTVKPGISFNFEYTSKISRELVMSREQEPDHVWEPQTTKLLLHLSKEQKHVLIGGGYFGDQAILVAKNMQNHGGFCHVFEANRKLFKMLEMNSKNNHLDNIILNFNGLWSDDTSKLKLIGDDDVSAYTEIVDASNEDDDIVSTISINTYCCNNDIQQIGLIMLDIEGGEYEVFKGADNLLSQSQEQAPVLIFEVHRHYCDWSNGLENTEIIQLLKEFGYQTYAIRDYQNHIPMGNVPIELIPPERTYLEGPPHGFNMLGIKNDVLIKSDIFRMCADVSPKLLLHKDPKLHHPMHVNGS